MQVISDIQKSILLDFPSVTDAGQFYLTGGTALAEFYLKHRKSNDLDFFTPIDRKKRGSSRNIPGSGLTRSQTWLPTNCWRFSTGPCFAILWTFIA